MRTWSIERTFISAYTHLAVAAQTLIDAFSTLEKVTKPNNDGAEELSKIEEEEEVWEPSFADAAASLADDTSEMSSVREDKRQDPWPVGPQLSGEEVAPTPPAASSPRLSADETLVTNVLRWLKWQDKWLNGQDNPLDLATWLEPAVITILDEHVPSASKISQGIFCLDEPNGKCHDVLSDWQDWQEHVAKLLCAHIVQALPDYLK